MKSRLLLIALLASFSCFGQDIVVNGETIGRFLDVNESLEVKPFTRQLSNGNYIRKFKGFKVELYPNLQIDRLCKFNKIKAILHLGLVTLVATIPGDGAGTFIKVVFIVVPYDGYCVSHFSAGCAISKLSVFYVCICELKYGIFQSVLDSVYCSRAIINYRPEDASHII